MITWKSDAYASTGRALLLDRDGVINKRVVGGYVLRWDDFAMIPSFRPAVQPFVESSIPLVMVSNQSCVGRGLIALDDLQSLMRQLVEMLSKTGIDIAGYVICPHAPDDRCECRKPEPGLLFAVRDVFGLDLSKCAFIGDSQSDAEAGARAGCTTLLVDSDDADQYRRTFARAYRKFPCATSVLQ